MKQHFSLPQHARQVECDGQVQDSVVFADGLDGWPTIDRGVSAQLIELLSDNNDGNNWCIGQAPQVSAETKSWCFDWSARGVRVIGKEAHSAHSFFAKCLRREAKSEHQAPRVNAPWMTVLRLRVRTAARATTSDSPISARAEVGSRAIAVRSTLLTTVPATLATVTALAMMWATHTSAHATLGSSETTAMSPPINARTTTVQMARRA